MPQALPEQRSRQALRAAHQGGAFTHADTAGAGSTLHFSGRIKGKRLTPGRYTLQAVASNAAGRGPVASAHFTIR